MNKENFEKLIQSITGRNLIIDTTDAEIVNGKEYFVYKHLPITDRKVYFKWKVAMTDEKMLRSFITAFCTHYREPDPRSYDYSARTYGESARWENRSEKDKEYAYGHHTSNMFSKDDLMKQIEANFNNKEIEGTLIRYGFYNTEYGIGIFALWQTQYVVNAINQMKEYLSKKSIPFTNEFSDARWVFRFKLNISKEVHGQILNSFN